MNSIQLLLNLIQILILMGGNCFTVSTLFLPLEMNEPILPDHRHRKTMNEAGLLTSNKAEKVICTKTFNVDT